MPDRSVSPHPDGDARAPVLVDRDGVRVRVELRLGEDAPVVQRPHDPVRDLARMMLDKYSIGSGEKACEVHGRNLIRK